MIKTLDELDRVSKSIFDKDIVNARSHYKKLINMISILDKNPNWCNFEKDEVNLLQQINENLLKADSKESSSNKISNQNMSANNTNIDLWPLKKKLF